MERIKAAFEKARRDRYEHESDNGVSDIKDEANLNLRQIVYTGTKVTQHDSEHLAANRLVAGYRQGLWTSHYKHLRTRVIHRLDENNWRTLAITSVNAGEGKSLTALNLSISIAQALDKTVLFVDADLTNPTAHLKLGVPGDRGLGDYLTEKVKLAELLINPGIPSFVFLPAGRPQRDSSEMLATSRMKSFVEEVKMKYGDRYIIFDLPALLSSPDVLAFSKYVDAFLFVAEEGRTKKRDFKKGLELLRNTPVLGAVLNKSKQTLIPFDESRPLFM